MNRDNYMLSDSRFNPAPSILKQKLSDENISSKFRERNGHKMVVDYRGCDVLTAFEVCTVFDSEWLIIAKINADEVITGHYEQYRESYQKLLMNSVNTADAKSCPPFDTDKRIIEVDMDEFCRAADKEVLFTRGVSTCTAVLISYPGRFSYLAHVSPFDRLYGENRTDLVGNMLRIINEFEVYPSEKQQLRFVVIAPSNQTVKNCVDMLVKEGYFLSQIKVLCNKDAQYANVFNDYENDRTVVQWKMAEEGLAFTSWDLADFKTVGEYARDNMSVPVN